MDHATGSRGLGRLCFWLEAKCVHATASTYALLRRSVGTRIKGHRRDVLGAKAILLHFGDFCSCFT